MKSSRAVFKELTKRKLQEDELAAKPKFSVEDYCFDKQINFIRDPAKFKTAVCSRRSGKTVSCAADLIETCISNPGVNVAYITLSRRSAKRIIWKDLKIIVQKYDLPVKEDNADLSMTFANGSTIYVSGATDESDIEKYRGMAFKKVYIDEVQSFPSYIEYLVDEILVPALYDYDGSLILTGTPGPVPAGYFYEAAHGKGWSNHRWTLMDNPFMELKSGKKVEEILRQERERRGIDETDPKYQRESLGLWTQDTNSLVFKFDNSKNFFETLPTADYEYIFGIDIGYDDADSISVLAYSPHDPCVYLVEEYIRSKQTISDLVYQINILKDKYKPIKMVMDAGALGKKIQEEILQRHHLYIEAADKSRKLEFIELMNDDMRTSKFKSFKGSRFSQDVFKVEWDRSNPEKPRISDVFHSDATDSALYAWRECRHYAATKATPVYKPNTNEYMKMLEEKAAAKLEEAQKKTGMEDIIGSQEDMDSLVEPDGILDVFDDPEDN